MLKCIKKIFLGFLCSIIVISSLIFPTFAAKSTNYYEELHEEVNCKYLDIYVQNGKNIIISISNKANFINRISAESEKYKLEKFISDPEGKDIVLNNIEQG